MKNLEQKIAHMVNTPGVYLIGDSRVLTSPKGQPFGVVVNMHGKLFSMKPDNVLDPNRFLASAIIAGPFIPPTS